MTERIDHAAKAQKLERTANAIINRSAMVPHMLAVIELDKARLHAQLALVEQQRIANLIAITGLYTRDADFTKPWTSTDDTDAWRAVRDEVAEALGLA